MKRLLLLALVACACGSSSSAVATSSPTPSAVLMGTVTMTRSSCSFSAASAHLVQGELTLKLDNRTGVSAGVDVWPMPGSRTFDDVVKYIADETNRANRGQDVLDPRDFFTNGGPSGQLPLGSTATSSSILVLGPGSFVLVCLHYFDKVKQERPSGVAGPVTVFSS